MYFLHALQAVSAMGERKSNLKCGKYLFMKKLNQISIAILCLGGLFKHNSYPYANILVSIGFIAVATTLLVLALSKDK